MIRVLCTLSLFVSIFSFAKAPSLQKYIVERWPGKLLECEAVAKDLGKRLEQQTGVTLYATGCTAEFNTENKMQLSYVAEEPLPLVTTIPRSMFTSIAYYGSYKTMGECEADIDAQSRVFLAETGLRQVFFAYCFRDSVGYSKPFGIRIDGFGQAKRTSYQYTETYFGNPLPSLEEVENRIRTALRDKGVRVGTVSLSHSLIAHRLLVQHYAEKRVILEHRENLSFASKELCLQQIQPLSAILGQSSEVFYTSWCANEPMHHRTQLIYLTNPESKRFETEDTPDRFDTFESCEAARPRIESFYKNVFKRNVFGVLCHGGFDNRFTAQVFYSKPSVQDLEDDKK